MTGAPACRHEAEIAALAWTGQWPARADADLLRHAADCPVCGDLVLVATAMADLDGDEGPAKVPDASAVWYAAQMRARQEYVRRAARPVLAAELTAVACGAAALFVVWRTFGTTILQALSSLTWMRMSVPIPGFDLGALAESRALPWVAAAGIAWALVVPTALYVARLVDRPPQGPHDRL